MELRAAQTSPGVTAAHTHKNIVGPTLTSKRPIVPDQAHPDADLAEVSRARTSQAILKHTCNKQTQHTHSNLRHTQNSMSSAVRRTICSQASRNNRRGQRRRGQRRRGKRSAAEQARPEKARPEARPEQARPEKARPYLNKERPDADLEEVRKAGRPR